MPKMQAQRGKRSAPAGDVILGRGSENGDGDLRYLHCETPNYCATQQH